MKLKQFSLKTFIGKVLQTKILWIKMGYNKNKNKKKKQKTYVCIFNYNVTSKRVCLVVILKNVFNILKFLSFKY